MMAVSSAGLFYFMMLGGGFGVQLGIPPEKADALLARVAPAECLYYTSWQGMAKPDPKSANHTEQLLAEEEVQHFFTELDRRISDALRKAAKDSGDPRAILGAEIGPNLLKTLLSHPTAIYLSDFKPKGDHFDAQGAMIVKIGEDINKVSRDLEKLQKMFLADKAETVEIAERTYYRLQLGEEVPPITWGTRGLYLIVGLGEGSVEAIFDNIRQGTAKWLTDLHEKTPVERVSSVTYANLAKFVKKVTALDDSEEAERILEALGLKNVSTYTSVTGLDESGFTSKTQIGIEGETSGVLKLLDAKPLSVEDFKRIPHNATFAMALQLEAEKTLDTVLEIAGKIEPGAPDAIGLGIKAMEGAVGIKLREELLQSLGDTWYIYASPSDGGVITGWTAGVEVRNQMRMAAVQEKLVAVAREAIKGGFDDAQIKEIEFKGSTIYYFTSSDEIPFAPAWCLTEKELVFGLYPQTVRAHMMRDEQQKSLASNPAISGQLKSDRRPLAVTYSDSRNTMKMVYPYVQMMAQMAFSSMGTERFGLDFDISILPSLASIDKHLQPSVGLLRRTADGIELESRRTIPSGNVGSSAPVMIALLLPAVQASRSAARRASAMNNLRQIALALQNYHDANRALPAAYNTDKDGKPLLSWRVHILPYIEAGALYERFHLDEPWDSEHNKKLIPLMPQVYRPPASKADPGKTNYLGVLGMSGAFVPPKMEDREKKNPPGLSLAAFTDGTSNTAMVVEANDESAVEWTKPSDFTPDAMKPLKGLLGLYPAGFQAGFADGSVHFLSNEIDSKILMKIFMRNDGEPLGEF